MIDFAVPVGTDVEHPDSSTPLYSFDDLSEYGRQHLKGRPFTDDVSDVMAAYFLTDPAPNPDRNYPHRICDSQILHLLQCLDEKPRPHT